MQVKSQSRSDIAKKSLNFHPLLNRLLISIQINITSIPHRNSLDKHTLLLSLLNITHDVDPRAHFHLISLDALKNMLDVHVGYDWSLEAE